MLLFFRYKNQISREGIRNLISLPWHLYYKFIWCTFAYIYIKYCFLFKYFFTFTNLASVSLFHQLAFARAFFTNLLHLLVHSWADLIHLNPSALAFAGCTHLHISSSFSLALLATSHSCVRKLNDPTVINAF